MPKNAKPQPMTAVERVREEVRLRNMSVRQAAAAGGISNTTWGDFYTTGIATPKIRDAVARAFGWELDWPDNPPPLPEARDDQVMSMLKTLLNRIDDLEQKVDRLSR